MGSKKQLPAYTLFNAAAMSGTNTITSLPTNIANLDNVGLQIYWTGTPVGTITVSCSPNDVRYDDLTFNPSITQPAGSAGGYLISLNQIPFPFIKVKYVNASGAGNLTVFITAKDLN